jgi:predicted ATPase
MGMELVGREPEVSWLHAALHQALEGRTQIRLISGSAGAGKSTLIEAFSAEAQTANEKLVVVGAQCDAHTGPSDPYLPFLSLLEQLTTAHHADEARRETAGLWNAARLQNVAKLSAEVLVQYAPELVGTLIPGSSAVVTALRFAAKQAGWLDKLRAVEKQASPSQVTNQSATDQAQIVQQYWAAISALARHHPMVIVLDDLHWIDNASCDLLFNLAVRAKDAPILIIGLYRPHEVALGRGGERHPLATVISETKRIHGNVLLELDHLGEQRERSFTTSLLNREPHRLSTEFVETFYHVTGGQALFSVELLRTLKERGNLIKDTDGAWITASTLDWSTLPARVEGVIEERIARLANELRELLTLASVEGDTFTVQVLAGIQKQEERVLLKVLSGDLEKRHRLVAESNVERVGRNWVAHYLFSHVLFQQYLYKELGRRERMLLHGEVGDQLEEIYKGQTERISLQLARHFRAAGNETKAIQYLAESSRRAIRACAYQEGQMQLEQALELLLELPDDEQRRETELELLVDLSNCLKSTRGWNAPEVVAIYSRARQLCRRLTKPTPHLAPVLFGMWAIRLLNLDFCQARELAEESAKLAQSLGDRSIELQARVSLANTCFWAGDFSATKLHLEGTDGLIDASLRQADLARSGQDNVVLFHQFSALLASLAGRFEEAIQIQSEMLRSAEELDHPFTLAIALQAAAWVQYQLRDPAESGRFAQRLIDLAEQRNFPFYRCYGLMFRGWARALQGDAAGEQDIDDGFVHGLAASGVKFTHTLYCLLKAECLRRRDLLPDALKTIEEGLGIAKTQGELAYVAELYRTKAELLSLIDPSDFNAAEAACAKGLAAANAQDAPLFAQRANETLARLQRSRRVETESPSVDAAV